MTRIFRSESVCGTHNKLSGGGVCCALYGFIYHDNLCSILRMEPCLVVLLLLLVVVSILSSSTQYKENWPLLSVDQESLDTFFRIFLLVLLLVLTVLPININWKLIKGHIKKMIMLVTRTYFYQCC